MSEILTGRFGVSTTAADNSERSRSAELPPSSRDVVHGRQLGEHGIHERFSPRADQISEIEQAIGSHRRWQGCFFCAGHPLFEQKDRIGWRCFAAPRGC